YPWIVNQASTPQRMLTSIPTNSNRPRRRLKTLALLAMLWCGGSTQAQVTQCKLKLIDLPQHAELRGFSLGMTMDQVKARVPQVVFGRVDEFGGSKTSINPHFDAQIDKTPFADVRTISLDFLDGRLTSLWIGYEQSFKWVTVEAFVKGISGALSLPTAWTPWKSRGQQLQCVDFQVTVSTVAGGPSFRILDLSAEETFTARRIALEEQRSSPEESGDGSEEIIGDKKSMIFYPVRCKPALEISEGNRVVFKTAEEAEKAKYKPAGNCPPEP
ncbi:MAG: hypothetical protein ACRD8U_01860, partial [Pyrinomonadaceae bacterium]